MSGPQQALHLGRPGGVKWRVTHAGARAEHVVHESEYHLTQEGHTA